MDEGTAAGGGGLNVTWFFIRNPANRIRTETQSNGACRWDRHGDKSWASAANGFNRYTSVDGVAHCCDANGNLTLYGVNVYLYDMESQLVEMRIPETGSATVQ